MQTIYSSIDHQSAINASTEDRIEFLKNTYVHLGYAILLFVILESLLLQLDNVSNIVESMVASKWSWLFTLSLFLGVSWFADKWAQSEKSIGKQYIGLGIFIVAESLVCLPLIFEAIAIAPDVIGPAGLVTILLVFGLSYTSYTSKSDFILLRQILTIGSFIAIGLIISSLVFGFTLGVAFSVGMVILAAGSIIHTTKQIQYEYRTDQYVVASLHLFSAIALLFWYILKIFIDLNKK